MSKQVFKTTLGNFPLTVEIGEMAKQASGSAVIRYGDTVILTTVVAKEKEETPNFFPLMVVYQEKLYAAGKIPGGFLRREGRPSEQEILISRLIDRPIRPLFPEGYRDDVQVINTVLSSDLDAPSEVAAMLGSSISLILSGAPYLGPAALVNVGLIDNKFILNPTIEEKEKSIIDLTVSGTIEAVNMVEASAKEVSEEIILDAIEFAHHEIKKLCEFQLEIKDKAPIKEKNNVVTTIDENIFKEVNDFIGKDLIKAVSTVEKHDRATKIDEQMDKAKTHFNEKHFFQDVGGIKVLDLEAKNEFMKQVNLSLDKIVTKEVRRLITIDKIRPDGRRNDEIRPLESIIDLLPRTHGSALFTRGQTQALGTVTLGSLGENQIIDGLEIAEVTKRFMLHYNFPPFSVGETGRYGAPGRREIGHGALGEKAILQVLPDEDEFPYSIRVVSEILESNGSSSQATICAASLSLMAAGVPIKSPVAGIAMGLIKEGDDYTILSDIQGMEDHEGDMDFKVAGTKDGITALQMDIKITGITKEIMEEALAQAKVGRNHILNHMNEVIDAPRKEVSKYAPKVKLIKIDPNKIRDVIGAGGKIISQIIEDYNDVKIDIEQDGRVFIMHPELKWIEKASEHILNLVKEAKVGEVYEAKVTRFLMDR
ncbi:MAG: polyribonucleotide nucleotidyltransferase, partial [Acholeplasmataceae bacterium]